MSYSKSFLHPVKIKNITIKGNLFLAPLAGYTDIPFRTLCLENGADLTTSEMVSCEGIARENKKTVQLMKRAQGEKDFAIQIFTDNLDSLERSFDILLSYNPTIIDINCGCPVPKVTKTGAGSALMKTPEKMGQLVNFLTKNTDIPVSIKFRTGWDLQSENYLDFAKIALDNGASLLTMHARTKSQGYAPYANWDRLATLVDTVHSNYKGINVFGSGDLFEAKDAKTMFEQTGVDGIMFARGAIGNPCIFDQTKYLLETGEDKGLTPILKRIEMIKKQLHLMCDEYGETVGTREMRKHCCAYLKGLPGSSKVKMELMKATSEEDYIKSLAHLID